MKIKLEDIKQIVEEVVKEAISEQEAVDQVAPAAATPAAAGGDSKLKADVDIMLKKLATINTLPEYEQLLAKVLTHEVPGGENVKRKALKAVLVNQFNLPTSIVDKILGA